MVQTEEQGTCMDGYDNSPGSRGTYPELIDVVTGDGLSETEDRLDELA
jgi:hypothetical protein